ncbi:MAG: beta strand repeat-containing protein [Myxococcales bacterium]
MTPIRTLALSASMTAALLLGAGCSNTPPASTTTGGSTSAGASAGTTGAASSSSGSGSTGQATTGAASSGSSTGRSTTSGSSGSTGRASTSGGSSSGASTSAGSTGSSSSSGASTSAGSTGGASSSSGASTSAGSTGGSSGSSGGSSGGSTGATCQNDPGCSADGGMACATDDAGAMIGSCEYGADGCLHVTGAAACPSNLQTCPSGDTSCQCPAGSCTPGSTQCDPSTGNVESCALDVSPGGCGVFADTTTCTAPQSCQVVSGSPACACPAVSATPTVGQGCTSGSANGCDANGTQIDSCNPVAVGATGFTCYLWQQAQGGACGTGLVCATPSGGTLGCYCPAHTAGQPYFVDPVAGSDSSAVNPTGIQNPAQCRYGTLTNGLAVAQAAGGTQTVEATGTTPVTFTKQAAPANSEVFPITVPAGVTLTTSDATPTPADFVIQFNDATATSAVVLGGDGATLRGFEITPAAGANTGNVFTVLCTGGAVTVDTIDLEGTGGGVSLPFGLSNSGTCAYTGTSVTANGFSSNGFNLASSGSSTFTGISVGSAAAPNGTGVWIYGSTASFTNGGIQNNSGVGLGLQGGTVTATGLTVESNQGIGVQIEQGTVASALTLTDGTVKGNGLAGNGTDGIHLSAAAGTLTINGTQVTGNGVNGLSMSAGTATLGQDANGTGAAFDGNGVNTGVSAGINISGGSVTATGIDASGNKGSGVAVTGGTSIAISGGMLGNNAAGVTYPGNGYDGLYVAAPAATAIGVHGVLIASNGARGIELTGGNAATVTVDDGSSATGTTITANGFAGADANVRAAAGTLNMTGTAAIPVTVSAAVKGLGLNLVGAAATLTHVSVTGNGAAGVRVDDGTDNAITINSSTLSNNTGDGLHVDRAPVTGGGGYVLRLAGDTIASNTAAGVNLAADTGAIGINLSSSTIRGNAGTGVVVNGANGNGNKIQAVFTGDTVELNNPAAAAGVGGGFSFSGPPATLASFFSNLVAGNGGDQILITNTGNGFGGTWELNGTNNTCSSANQIYCAPGSSVGVRFVAPNFTFATVDAANNSWTTDPPTPGTDYGYSGGTTGGITVSPSCSAVAACPLGICTCP